MGVGPGDPWVNGAPHGVCDDTPKGERDGEGEIEGSQSDEAPVATVSQVGIGGDEIPELLSPLHECTDGED